MTTSPPDEAAKRPTRPRKRAAPPAGDDQSVSKDRVTAEAAPDEDLAVSGQASNEAPAQPTLERAEVLLDQAGQQVGQFISDLGHRLRVVSARAREEAEDIWAEAKSLRNKERP